MRSIAPILVISYRTRHDIDLFDYIFKAEQSGSLVIEDQNGFRKSEFANPPFGLLKQETTTTPPPKRLKSPLLPTERIMGEHSKAREGQNSFLDSWVPEGNILAGSGRCKPLHRAKFTT